MKSLLVHWRMAAERVMAAAIALLLGVTACHGADTRRSDACRVVDRATSDQLVAKATAFFQEAASASVRLEPFCIVDGAPGHLLANVGSQPTEQANGTIEKYAAVCLYERASGVWSCDDFSAVREISVVGRAPVKVEWDIDVEVALNVVRFLTERSANETLRLNACGSTAAMAFSSTDLRTVTRVYRPDPEFGDINARLEGGLTISFGTLERSRLPVPKELCWLPGPRPAN